MAFDNRKEADDFMQSRQKHVLGAVHFINSPTKQLQYIIQSNTSVSSQACTATAALMLHVLQSMAFYLTVGSSASKVPAQGQLFG